MPADIVIQRGSTQLNGLTFETVDVAITLQGGDASKAFVRLATGSPYILFNVLVLNPRDSEQYSCSVRILNATTLRCQTQPGGTLAPKVVDWEIWEYLGDVGGPNEFIVRNQSNVLVTGVGGAVANPWTMINARDNIIFSGGIIWEGPTAGAAKVPASGLTILQCDRISDTNWFRFLRGVDDSNNFPRHFYTAVEFTGSNWDIRYTSTDTPPVDTTVELVWENGGNVLDWDKTFVIPYRRANAHTFADMGMVVWPGTDTSKVRLSYPANGSTAEPFNSSYISAISNPDIDVEWKDSVTGGETSHPSPSTFPQIVDVPTLGVKVGLTRSSVIITHDDPSTTLGFPGFIWSGVLQSDGVGGFEVKWKSRDGGGITRWSQQVIHFESIETVSWVSKTLQVNMTSMGVFSIPGAVAFVDFELGILTTVGADLQITAQIDFNTGADSAVNLSQALAAASDGELSIEAATELAAKIIRGGLNPKG